MIILPFIFTAVGIVCVCIRSFISLYRRYSFFVHFVTVDLYRYEFAERCPLPAKAVGEGCVGIGPLFVRRWFGKCISFQTRLFWVSMLDFRGVTTMTSKTCEQIGEPQRADLFGF